MKKATIKINILIMTIVLPMIMILKTLVEGKNDFPALLSMRRFTIMSKTVAFGLLVGILVVVISWFVAYSLFVVFDKPMLIYVVLMILTILPSFLYAYVWMHGFQMIFGRVATSGLFISVVVQVNYFMFFATLLWYHTFCLISQEYFDVAYLNQKVNKSHVRVLMEMSRLPFMLFVQLFLLLAMTDYTIPSIFAYNTYPIEIMSVFASSLSLVPPIMTSVPMIIVTILLVGMMTKNKDISLISSIDSTKHYKPQVKLPMKVISWIVLAFLMCPFILMFISGIRTQKFLETVFYYIDDYVYTLLSAMIAGFLIVVYSYLLNFYTFVNHKKKKPVSIMMIILFGIPGTGIGLLVNAFYHEVSSLVPVLDWISLSLLPIIHFEVLRFLPIGYLILSIGFKLIPRSYIEQGMMETHNHIRLIKHGVIHVLSPYILLTGFICFVLSISELSGAIMVLPPGKSTITVTIYNYLHYGSTDIVAALSLTLLAIILVVTSLFYALFNKKFFKKF